MLYKNIIFCLVIIKKDNDILWQNGLLSNTISTTNIDAKFIFATFNQNTWEVMHVIAIYRPLKMHISYFISILETILKKILVEYPIVMIGDINVDMFTSMSQSITLQKIMNKYGFKNILPFKTTITHK